MMAMALCSYLPFLVPKILLPMNFHLSRRNSDVTEYNYTGGSLRFCHNQTPTVLVGADYKILKNLNYGNKMEEHRL
jgi:hypothetical protein